jgi:hypothetical protein
MQTHFPFIVPEEPKIRLGIFDHLVQSPFEVNLMDIGSGGSVLCMPLIGYVRLEVVVSVC